MAHRLIEVLGSEKKPLGCFFDQYPVYKLYYSSSEKILFEEKEYSQDDLATVLNKCCDKECVVTVLEYIRRCDTLYCYIGEEGYPSMIEYDGDR